MWKYVILQMLKVAICALTCWIVLVMPAFACYTGLGVIPTADIIQPGALSLEMQMESRPGSSNIDTCIINTQYGISSRWEAGVDFDFSRNPTGFLNAKYLLASDITNELSLAVGFSNLAVRQKTNPYIVVSRGFGAFRGHAGIMRIDGADVGFGGIDRSINNRLTLMVDYTCGQSNAASVGGSYQFNNKFGIGVFAHVPKSSVEDSYYCIHYVWTR